MKSTLAAITMFNLFGCQSSALTIQRSTEDSLPREKTPVTITKTKTPRHTLFQESPRRCSASGKTLRANGFNVMTAHLDCEEPCVTEVRLPEPCESNDYSSLNELEQQISWKTVRLGGYFFQSNEQQPCSMVRKGCCNSCAEYMILTDFEDMDDWFSCKRVYIDHDEKVILGMFSMEGSCCTLNDLRFPAIITGKVEKRKGKWYFSEVQSICRIP